MLVYNVSKKSSRARKRRGEEGEMEGTYQNTLDSLSPPSMIFHLWPR